jgi:hydroxymethylbilane synthase
LKIAPMRGNVPTRVTRIREGRAEATVLAMAGLERLNLSGAASQVFTPEEITPAMGQGALAIEVRRGEGAEWLRELEDPAGRSAIDAERAFVARVGGGCRTPVGAHVERLEGGRRRLTAMLASADGRSLLRDRIDVDADADLRGAALGLAEAMLARADAAILATLDRPRLGPSAGGSK